MREEPERPYDEMKAHGQVVKGEEAFADRIFLQAGEAPLVRKRLGLAAVASAVSRREGVSLVEMRGSGRGRKASRARLLTAWLARDVGGLSLSRSARFFGRDPSTFARGIGELEQTIAKDPHLKATVARLTREVRRKALPGSGAG